jgi:hypothetical protein
MLAQFGNQEENKQDNPELLINDDFYGDDNVEEGEKLNQNFVD